MRNAAQQFLHLVAATIALGASALAQAQADPRALQAFETVRSVLQHPRCQNCHIPGDAPLQLDEGRTHSMSVKRGPVGMGATAMECPVCHGQENPPESYGLNVPPGAPNWHLPPPATKMVFIGLTPAALCATIKDRAATGGKDLRAMHAHLRDDKLVAWGWSPGPGRNPPPISKQNLVAAFQEWMNLGAPCPG